MSGEAEDYVKGINWLPMTWNIETFKTNFSECSTSSAAVAAPAKLSESAKRIQAAGPSTPSVAVAAPAKLSEPAKRI